MSRVVSPESENDPGDAPGQKRETRSICKNVCTI